VQPRLGLLLLPFPFVGNQACDTPRRGVDSSGEVAPQLGEEGAGKVGVAQEEEERGGGEKVRDVGVGEGLAGDLGGT